MLAATARSIANQANAQHSTGPRTLEGKSASSRNSLTHGLTSKQVILPHEDAEEYERIRANYHRELKPLTTVETVLIDQVVQTNWRLKRAWTAETTFFQLRIAEIRREHPEFSGEQAHASIFIDEKELARFALIQRYVTQAERAHERAMAEFRRVQKVRWEYERQKAVKETQAKLAAFTSASRVNQPAPAPHHDDINPVPAPAVASFRNDENGYRLSTKAVLKFAGDRDHRRNRGR